MVSRREMLTRGLVGGFMGTAVSPDIAAGAQEIDRQTIGELNKNLEGIRLELGRHTDTTQMFRCGALDKLRALMRMHLRSHRRFPAYFEVGYGIWTDAYDWLVASRQPPVVSRLADGRYTLGLMQSTLILRPETDDDFVSVPFDVLEGQP